TTSPTGRHAEPATWSRQGSWTRRARRRSLRKPQPVPDFPRRKRAEPPGVAFAQPEAFMAEPLRNIAAEFVDRALEVKPELVIQGGNLPASVEALRDLLASSGTLFERGVPVRLVATSNKGPPSVVTLSKNNVVIEAHRLCQPVKLKSQDEKVEITLPDRVAQMYLDSGEWQLQPLTGISMSPLLSNDGNL